MLSVSDYIAGHLGQLLAATTGVLGPLAVVANQAPIAQEGLDPIQVALLAAIGPAVTWLAGRILASLSAYFKARSVQYRLRAEKRLSDDDKANDEEAQKLLEKAEDAQALAEAFAAKEDK